MTDLERLAETLGVTPEEVSKMSWDDLRNAAVSLLARKDQAEAAVADLNGKITGEQP